jgi:hypothetical protein
MRRSADHGNFAQEWSNERWHAGERRGTNGVEFRIDRSTPMDAATSLDDTVRKAQDILWDALPPGAVRRSAVRKLRDLLGSPEVGAALAISPDNYPAFALRESRLALEDTSAWPDKTLSALWTILDDPALNAALGIPQDRTLNAPRRNYPWR